MKRLIFSLALMMSLSSFAQYRTTYTKQNVTFAFWQYTTYSSYAGYLMQLTNGNDVAQTYRITSGAIAVDTLVTLQAHEYQVLQLGYSYVSAGNAYIPGLRFNLDFTNNGAGFWIETNNYY